MSSDRAVERDGEPNDTAADREELAARAELLERENRRLRDRIARTRRTSHHRTALGLAAVGVVAGVGALAFPASRTVLFALAGTGLFAAVLTYYLTPERFIAAAVGERVYAATASTGDELIADLGLTDVALYVPTADVGDESFAPVRLFVPQHRNYAVPDADALDSALVVSDDERGRGVSLLPTGAGLFREFETSLAGDLAADPATLAAQLGDALVEDFELVDSASVEYDAETDRVTVAVIGSAYGPVTRFDHPVASFVATGLAVGLQTPVRLEAVDADDERGRYLVTCDLSDESA